jgi:DNA ligase D-like protein (predicted 3'-phosphoesterase)
MTSPSGVTLFCSGTAGHDNRPVNPPAAKRIRISGRVSDPALRKRVRRKALKLGLAGWVRLMEDGSLCIHAEDNPSALEELTAWLETQFDAVQDRPGQPEGHEQFAIRGVSAGVFVVQEHQARAHHFDLRLEVDGVMRSWAVPKGPSMDPTVKRLAVEVEDHGMGHNDFEGPTDGGGVIIWDRGSYEQGGRVPWPEALDRGHAVFVLHGEKLSGGFALQRTSEGSKPQWLLIKRRDEHAQRGSDIVAQRPESVRSGLTLDALREA